MTDNESENAEFDNTTLSGTAGLALSKTATLRFVGRAELGTVGTPGQTAFGRPDLDAGFERRNGVGGVTFTQAITPSLSQRATYGADDHASDLDQPDPRSALHARRSRDSTAPFEFSDFSYNTHNELRRHYATYQADWRLPTTDGAAGTHLTTTRARLGWRAGAADGPAGEHVGQRLAQQRRLDDPAPGAVVAGVRHRRAARRAQRQLRHRGGAARIASPTSRTGRRARSARPG